MAQPSFQQSIAAAGWAVTGHHRDVALKVLRPELGASVGSERFLREIEIAARLTHPHIFALYDSGEAAGALYYVMPWVRGESLRSRLAREGELPVADACRILRDVADALAAAHREGVVHRDIKPENILLTSSHALVADFGVAKAVSAAAASGATLTTEGLAVGTPAYMAPEQAAGDPHVDARADLYALGVVAYEMLAGRAVHRGDATAGARGARGRVARVRREAACVNSARARRTGNAAPREALRRPSPLRSASTLETSPTRRTCTASPWTSRD